MPFITDALFVPILKGKLAGMKWLINAGGKILRLMFSTYEPEQTALFETNIKPGTVVFDVGAHAGYYTLLSSVLVGPAGKVLAFEPNPCNYRNLVNNVRINGLGNVEMLETAVSDENGHAFFAGGSGSGTGRLAGEGGIRVRTIRLDDLVVERHIRPDVMKIDTEGAEMLVLSGARQLLTESRPILFLSTHGKEVHEKCCAFLKDLKYDLKPILGNDVNSTSELICYPI
jgi:FkbM family methyltransferase